MSDVVKTFSDASFEADVLKSTLPVLVDFWAEWCGPCKMLGPIFGEVAGQFQGKVVFGKVNVDHNNDTPAKYGIRGIPTMLLFKNGQVAATKVGALTKGQLVEFVNAHLK